MTNPAAEIEALVIGAGPAGLMAADTLSANGVSVVIAEAKPSIGRKFLMAGKSGLNLTKAEPPERFAAKISAPWLRDMVTDFGPDAVQHWARGLGHDVFSGSSGRVFPIEMKASPFLRSWAARLAGAGVVARTRWRWQGFDRTGMVFATPEGSRHLRPRVTILALGGASWPNLGSDGAWVPWLEARGVTVNGFRPANMGLSVDWSAHMARHFGQPLKGIALVAGGERHRGECVISARGLEGSGIYAAAAAVRDGAALTFDLAPDLDGAEIAARLAAARKHESLANVLRKAGFDGVKLALLNEWGRRLPPDPVHLAAVIKSLPARHLGPRPLEEAISSAGGIAQESLGPGLELKALPGFFAAGEMLDWEAPTGGYLITTCLATGWHAGRAAASRLGKL